MATFLSALTLVVLVLANSCFPLPLLNEDLSTVSSLNKDLTTELSFNERSKSYDEITVSPTLPSRRSSDEHMGFEFSSTIENLSEEHAARITRALEQSSMLTTEASMAHEREQNETSFITIRPLDLGTAASDQDKLQVSVLSLRTDATPELTTEKLVHNKRNQEDSLLITVKPEILTTEKSAKKEREFSAVLYDIVEPLLLTTERAMNNESRAVDSSSITVEPLMLTTEKSAKKEREFSAVLYDIVEPLLLTTERAMNNGMKSNSVETITHGGEIQKRNFENGAEFEPSDEATTEKSSVRSTSRGKSSAHSEDSSEQVEGQERPKPSYRQRKPKPSSSPKPSSDYSAESKELSKGSTVPTAELDQDASKKLFNVPSDFLILDETVEVIVTDLPERFSNTTMETAEQAKPLNQGQKSSDIEEKESNH